jgi:sterol desaturase/sphingolipid hydroxylase (fatty acid hydroxylase superfamily)
MANINVEAIKIGLIFGGLIFFLILELIIPYRENSISKIRRWMNNLTLGIINIIFYEVVVASLLVTTASFVAKENIGLMNLVEIPTWLKIVDTIVFMDLMFYFLHILIHRIPLLWRFHRVHHTDLDVDVSTAMRFHLIEVFFRSLAGVGMIYFIGADPVGVFVFECLFLFSFFFQHSGIKLPRQIENLYWILFVPPPMHRIHHSVDLEERNTNFGGIFSIWDRIFGTLLTGVNQDQIWMGVDGHIQEKKLEIYHLLWMPFTPKVK